MSSVIATIVPVFGLIALGFFAGRSGYLSDAAAKGLPEFVFKLAMPVMLFRTIGAARMPDVATSRILLSFFGAAAVTWLCAAMFNRLLKRPAADGAALGMGATFSNSVMMGIPICLSHFGPDAAPILALIALCDTAILWLWATLHLAATEGVGKRSLGGLIGNLFLRLATNPIIVGCAAGLVWQLAGFTMPPLANTFVSMLAGAAIPGALVAMGLALNGYGLTGSMPAVTIITALKLILMPIAAWVLAVHVFELPTLVAGVVVMLAAMPVGANAYLFATAYDRAPAVVSGAIALSTPLALLTLSALLAILGGGAP
jgi:predicted permease